MAGPIVTLVDSVDPPAPFGTSSNPFFVSTAGTGNTVTLTHTTVATSTTTGVALAANASAKYRLFENVDDAIVISLKLSVAAVSLQGIVLYPHQSYEMSVANHNLDTRVVNCIAASGTPSLLVTEG